MDKKKADCAIKLEKSNRFFFSICNATQNEQLLWVKENKKIK